MATTRAKFGVTSVTDYGHSKQVVLNPVYSNDPESENKAFWDATPNGNITMHIKSAAGEHFKPGQAFYVDFTPAD